VKFGSKNCLKSCKMRQTRVTLSWVSVPEPDSQQLKTHGRTIRTRTDNGGNPRFHSPYHL
jgi:hypothetical protein